MTDGLPAPLVRHGTEADAVELSQVQCAAALKAYRSIFPPEAAKPTPTELRPSWERLLRDPEVTVLVAEQPALTVVGGVAVGPDEVAPRSRVSPSTMPGGRAWRLGHGGVRHLDDGHRYRDRPSR